MSRCFSSHQELSLNASLSLILDLLLSLLISSFLQVGTDLKRQLFGFMLGQNEVNDKKLFIQLLRVGFSENEYVLVILDQICFVVINNNTKKSCKNMKVLGFFIGKECSQLKLTRNLPDRAVGSFFVLGALIKNA